MRSSTTVLEEVPARFSRFCSFVLARAGQSADRGPVLGPRGTRTATFLRQVGLYVQCRIASRRGCGVLVLRLCAYDSCFTCFLQRQSTWGALAWVLAACACDKGPARSQDDGWNFFPLTFRRGVDKGYAGESGRVFSAERVGSQTRRQKDGMDDVVGRIDQTKKTD